jgi:hypothetical protein
MRAPALLPGAHPNHASLDLAGPKRPLNENLILRSSNAGDNDVDSGAGSALPLARQASGPG